MTKRRKTPGIYIQDISTIPPTVAAVDATIPVFIGYTERIDHPTRGNLIGKPQRINSLQGYEALFGGPKPETGIDVAVRKDARTGVETISVALNRPSKFKLYYSLRFYFANGGDSCYIVSTGDYLQDRVDFNELRAGLTASNEVDDITLILFTDAQALSLGAYYALYEEAIDSAADLKDRFVIVDVYDADNRQNSADTPVTNLRNTLLLAADRLRYSAVYYPNLETILPYTIDEDQVKVSMNGGVSTLSDLKGTQPNTAYHQIKAAVLATPMVMPPSAGMAGVYATVDRERGIWKAPANTNMNAVVRTTQLVSEQEQQDLNVDAQSGKSINVIRPFTGRGPAVVWGARTLAGNDNEWRYIPVRRLALFIEKSVKHTCAQFSTEPNDANTWVRVRAMIENFLITLWRQGALQGIKPDQAFYVAVGLNQTMTFLDVLQGRMIVEIGIAAVRPAEFIVLKFSQQLPGA